MAAVRAMGDVVIKPIFGSMGHGMVRVSDPDVAFRVVRALEQMRSVFYVQRAIDHGGRDVRVFVVGGRVLGAIERRAPAGEWRTNVALGGSARPSTFPLRSSRLALRAAAAVGADYAGVDLLPVARRRVFVLEVNGIPGWQGLQQATGIDVAAAIVEHLERVLQPSSHASAGELAGMSGVYRELAAGAPGSRSRSSAAERRRRRAAGVPARSRARRSQATSRPAGISPTCATRISWRAPLAIGAPLAGAGERSSARRSGWRSRRPHAGRARTPISASCCCSRRWREPPSALPGGRTPAERR